MPVPFWQDPYILPLNLRMVVWEPGYGKDNQAGPGNLGTFSTAMLSPTQMRAAEEGELELSLAPFIGLPRIFSYNTQRALVITASDQGWVECIFYIDGMLNGEPNNVTLEGVQEGATVTNTLFDEILDIRVSFGDFVPQPTSVLLFDQGWAGYSPIMEMDPRCSSWVASIQVVPGDTGAFKYTALGDNTPRNALKNIGFPNGPNTVSLYGKLGLTGYEFPISADVTDATTAKLEIITTPVHNVYVKISEDSDNGATGSILLLQDSRWGS